MYCKNNTNRFKIMKYLIHKGVDINIISDYGKTILDLALYDNEYDIIELLLKYGTKMYCNAKNNKIKEIDNMKIIRLLINSDSINNYKINKNIDNLLKERYNDITKYMNFKEIHICNIIKKLK